jgi:Rieske Fe-S protein
LLNWNPSGSTFLCPCHGAQFSEEGDHLPADAYSGIVLPSLQRFPTQVIDGQVLIQVSAPGSSNNPRP